MLNDVHTMVKADWASDIDKMRSDSANRDMACSSTALEHTLVERTLTDSLEHVRSEIQIAIAEETAIEQPQATETKAPEYIGAVVGKYQWDDRSGGDADRDVQHDTISRYCW